MFPEPICIYEHHSDGIEVSDWQPEHRQLRVIETQYPTPSYRYDTVQASVHVTCRRHRWSGRVSVNADWRPPGFAA
ncbi:hypothetical protein ACWEPL_12425 [Nonomuraea sp. NPDC004186]